MSRSDVWNLEDALNDEAFDTLWAMVDILKSVIPLDDTDSIVEEEECDYPAALEVRIHRCQTGFIAPSDQITFDNS